MRKIIYIAVLCATFLSCNTKDDIKTVQDASGRLYVINHRFGRIYDIIELDTTTVKFNTKQ